MSDLILKSCPHLRQVYHDLKPIPGYFVTQDGNVYTSRVNTRKNGQLCYVISDRPEDLKIMAPTPSWKINQRKARVISAYRIHVSFPAGLFDYDYQKVSKTNQRKKLLVHQMVMDSWRPIDEFPVIPMEDWIATPESAKEWIRKSVVINHIDHDPTNNHIDNLERCLARDNTREAVKHYGGHLANKDTVDYTIQQKKKTNTLTKYFV